MPINKETTFVGPAVPIAQPGLLTWLTFMAHNFVSIGQILTKPVTIDSPGEDLNVFHIVTETPV